ncbi:hypothetical protein HQ590_06400 [bacterium]|nr:hypothetical protein [bacterium]
MDSLAAEMIGVPLSELHTNVDAIVRAADALAEVAARLGVPAPPPRLAGLSYVHVSTLGVPVIIEPAAAEPYTRPIIKSPADIDRLREPDDYLAAGLVPQRLALAEQLHARRPDAAMHIGHSFEGPVTTAVLLMGQDFFMLPYDDPQRAHALLTFVTGSAIRYCRAISAHQQQPLGNTSIGFPDDFAGMFRPELFAEFVVPYWQRIYEELGATERSLHSELLREEHLPYLAELRIDSYDPSVDQYLPAAVLKRSCPVPYGLRIWPSTVRDESVAQLVDRYRRYAADAPQYVMFHHSRLAEEEKIKALLSVARELAA